MIFTETPIRHRPDGSIDTAFYLAHGRRLRARAAHAGLCGLLRALCRARRRHPRRPHVLSRP